MVIECGDESRLFKIYNPHAGSVEIRGSFAPADGSGIPMTRDPQGWWSARVRLKPGDYTFRYIINGDAPMPDYAASGLIRDQRGEWMSCLTVPEPRPKEAVPGREAAVVTVSTARPESDPAVERPRTVRWVRDRAPAATARS